MIVALDSPVQRASQHPHSRLILVAVCTVACRRLNEEFLLLVCPDGLRVFYSRAPQSSTSSEPEAEPSGEGSARESSGLTSAIWAKRLLSVPGIRGLCRSSGFPSGSALPRVTRGCGTPIAWSALRRSRGVVPPYAGHTGFMLGNGKDRDMISWFGPHCYLCAPFRLSAGELGLRPLKLYSLLLPCYCGNPRIGDSNASAVTLGRRRGDDGLCSIRSRVVGCCRRRRGRLFGRTEKAPLPRVSNSRA